MPCFPVHGFPYLRTGLFELILPGNPVFMARRPNFDYEKRQREIAKRKKKAEKLERKASRKSGGDDGASSETPPAPQEPEH